MRAVRRCKRPALAVLLALPLWLAVLPGEAAGQSAAALPIFDAHVHYSRGAWEPYPVDGVQRKLDAAGVRRALVSSSPDDGTLRLHRAAPRRFVPVLRPYRGDVGPGNWARDPATPDYLRGRLAMRDYAGIGEFHLLDAAEARTPVVRAVARMAAARGLFLHVHSDAGPVETLFALEPDVRILWGHAGMITPVEEVRALLERHPHLWAELSFREHTILGGGDGDPAWLALLTEHRRRFLVGADTYTPSRWGYYADIIATHRRYLALLPPAVARAIAYGNAVRLFGAGGVDFPPP